MGVLMVKVPSFSLSVVPAQFIWVISFTGCAGIIGQLYTVSWNRLHKPTASLLFVYSNAPLTVSLPALK